MSFQKPLNFGVIGCGMLARQQHIPNIAKSEKTVLRRPQPALEELS